MVVSSFRMRSNSYSPGEHHAAVNLSDTCPLQTLRAYFSSCAYFILALRRISAFLRLQLAHQLTVGVSDGGGVHRIEDSTFESEK